MIFNSVSNSVFDSKHEWQFESVMHLSDKDPDWDSKSCSLADSHSDFVSASDLDSKFVSNLDSGKDSYYSISNWFSDYSADSVSDWYLDSLSDSIII